MCSLVYDGIVRYSSVCWYSSMRCSRPLAFPIVSPSSFALSLPSSLPLVLHFALHLCSASIPSLLTPPFSYLLFRSPAYTSHSSSLSPRPFAFLLFNRNAHRL